ncbi:DUF3800 domain-containing protein [bacterium]|nr:DUF3800 domain-containing protein [bacterium]
MHLIYIDDSRDEKLCVFSALAIAAEEWINTFKQIKSFRHSLKESDGIYIYKELHAWKFVSGRGKISPNIVAKGRRCHLFNETLKFVGELPAVRLFNAVFPSNDENTTFEWLLNRINKAMQVWDSHAIIICDKGKELIYTRIARKMHVFNPIHSAYGNWEETGQPFMNIPIDRILEDPFFKDSQKSYFIQLVDFCAYALLRRENPIQSKTKYGLDKSFYLLSDILVREASKYDSEGIIRPKKTPSSSGF